MEFDTEDSIQCTQSDVQMTDLRLLHHQENFAYTISFFLMCLLYQLYGSLNNEIYKCQRNLY